MISINFVDTGLDDRILKSIPVDNCPEELMKAVRDRTKLVPKVIVDKNGNRRTVLVRPDKDIKKDKVNSNFSDTSQKDKAEKESSEETFRFSYDELYNMKPGSILCRHSGNGDGSYIVYQKTEKNTPLRTKWSAKMVTSGGRVLGKTGVDINKIKNHDFINPPKIVKDHLDEIHNYLSYTTPVFVERKSKVNNAKKTPNKSKSDTQSTKKPSTQPKTATQSTKKTLNNSKKPSTQPTKTETSSSSKSTMTQKDKIPKSTQKPQTSANNNSNNSSNSKKLSYYKASDATKQKVMKATDGMSGDDVVKMCKDKGIEWEEHSHKGINNMRAKMALAKYFDDGGK